MDRRLTQRGSLSAPSDPTLRRPTRSSRQTAPRDSGAAGGGSGAAEHKKWNQADGIVGGARAGGRARSWSGRQANGPARRRRGPMNVPWEKIRPVGRSRPGRHLPTGGSPCPSCSPPAIPPLLPAAAAARVPAGRLKGFHCCPRSIQVNSIQLRPINLSWEVADRCSSREESRRRCDGDGGLGHGGGMVCSNGRLVMEEEEVIDDWGEQGKRDATAAEENG